MCPRSRKRWLCLCSQQWCSKKFFSRGSKICGLAGAEVKMLAPESRTIHVEFSFSDLRTSSQKFGVSSRAGQPAFLSPKIRFARITELVLGCLGAEVAPFAPY